MKRPTPNPGILDIAPYVGGKSKGVAGVESVKLSSNESPLGPSPRALAAYADAAKTLHRYPDGHAVLLREAIADVQALKIDRIICGAGSDELIGILTHCYCQPGDEVIISEHGFLMYKIYAQSTGAKAVFAPEKNLCADVDAMLACVSARTKIVFLTNANNPTGSYLSKREIERLHKNLPPHVILAIDGAYAEYAEISSPVGGRLGGGQSCSTEQVSPPPQPSPLQGGEDYTSGRELAESAENVLMLRTFSKIYGLASLRIGWAYGPAHMIDAMNRIRGPFNVSGSAIAAGAAAMRDQAFMENARQFNRTWLDYLSKEISALGIKTYPTLANFVLVEFKDAATASAANLFLMKQGLIVREVANYGLPACLRISVGLEKDNRAVVRALADFLKK